MSAAGKGSTAEEFCRGDWNCPSCGDHNFARNSVCRKCGAPKPGTAGGGGGGGGSLANMRPGDWSCPKCGDLQFARNSACRRCGTEKGAQAVTASPLEQGPPDGAVPMPHSAYKPVAGSTPFFEFAPAFMGARPGYVFKLDHMGLGYYLDAAQSLLPKVREQLPEACRDTSMREERLRVDPNSGAGVALEPCDFGFLVEKVEVEPGQNLMAGDVIVAVEGRMFVGISGEQMKASFLKRRIDGARLAVVNLEAVKARVAHDPSVIEGWDARNGCKYFFSKRTGQSAWSIEELKKKEAPKEAVETKADAPVDLSHFLQHGFMKPLESEQDQNKKRKKKDTGELEKDESDMARAERSRWNDWNDGGRGGYTEAFFAKYRNVRAFPEKQKPDKRLPGSYGPGLGCDRFEKWTGSKNSFN